MSTENTQSLNTFQQRKDNQFKAQLKQIHEAFRSRPMTMKEADVYTGIMRENICRHVDTLLDQGMIAIRRKRKCSVTGYPYVNEYTGDPTLFPKSNQLKMFDYGKE